MAITTPLSNQPEVAKTCAVEQPKKTRHVMFNEAANVSHANEAWTAEDCQRLWYTKFDYQQIKEATYSLAKQLCKRERKQTDMDTVSNVILRVYDACCEATQDQASNVINSNDLALLTKFVGKSHSRAGIEKMYIRELGYDKKQRRVQLAQTVCTLQNKSHPHMVRLASESLSRASRLFAYTMAVALAESMEC